MNIINIAKCCLKIIEEEHDKGIFYYKEFLNKDHVVKLFQNIADQTVIGEQAHRHLGWAQAAMYLQDLRTLEDLKLINKSDGEFNRIIKIGDLNEKV